MKQTLLVYVTKFIDEAVLSEYRKMKNTLNVNVVLLVDNRFAKYDVKDTYIKGLRAFGTEFDCVFFDDVILGELGIKPFHCEDIDYIRDYLFYIIRRQFPEYNYYWMINQDVYLNSSDCTYSCLMNRFKNNNADFVSNNVRKYELDSDWMWTHNLAWVYKECSLYGCLLFVVRLSGRAIDFLYSKRKKYGGDLTQEMDEKKWPHSEVFVPTEIMNQGFSYNDLDESHVTFNKVIDFNINRIFEKPDELLYRPIKISYDEKRRAPISKYDTVTSLGYNCEVSWRIQDYFGRLEAQLFSWLYISDRERFLDVLVYPEKILSGAVNPVGHDGMFRCEESYLNLHSISTEEQIVTNSGRISAIKEMKERYGYLRRKFQKLCRSTKRTLFVTKLHATSKKTDEEYIIKLVEVLEKIYTSGNYRLCIVFSKEEIAKVYSENMLPFVENERLMIRSVDYFSEDGDTNFGGDHAGWKHVLDEAVFS